VWKLDQALGESVTPHEQNTLALNASLFAALCAIVRTYPNVRLSVELARAIETFDAGALMHPISDEAAELGRAQLQSLLQICVEQLGTGQS
jgi:hypothetical protein